MAAATQELLQGSFSSLPNYQSKTGQGALNIYHVTQATMRFDFTTVQLNKGSIQRETCSGFMSREKPLPKACGLPHGHKPCGHNITSMRYDDEQFGC